MSKYGSNDRQLSEAEERETEIFILENQYTQYKLYDARVNLAAINLVESFLASGKNFDEAISFVQNTTSIPEVGSVFITYAHASASRRSDMKTQALKIIEDLG